MKLPIEVTYIKESPSIHSRYENLISNYEVFKNEVVTTVYIVDSESERSNWNTTLTRVSHDNGDIKALIFSFSDAFDSYNDKDRYKYENFFRKVNGTYNRYLSESEDNEINKFHQPSSNSFLQLIRFIPEFPERNLEVYLDEMTGCFGVTIKTKTKGKPILNLLMKENKEVIFSFIKRRHKIIKISGRAYFNDHLEDSDEIRKIIRMISE